MFLLFLFVANSRIIITEVMSNVKGSESTCGKRNEFVEIYNQSADTVDLSSYFIYDFGGAIPDEIFPWSSDSILIKYPGVRINSTLIYPRTYALILDRNYTSSDTTGGNVQPYEIPDSTLILTTDDQTIGDGLTTNDPLILFSNADACTTSFGTPYDSLDEFPADPGDGISWERIDLSLPDSPDNWCPSIDSSGCTPGRENSATNAYDLAVEENAIFFIPAILEIGEDLNIEVRIKNKGLRAVKEYSLSIFDDQNSDSIIGTGELLTQLPGKSVSASDSASLLYTYKHPTQGEHRLGFKIELPNDNNLTNNLAFKTLQVLDKIGGLMLSPEIFSPNNDGIDDRLHIDVRLPEPGGELTITIFDTRGKRVCDLCKKNIAADKRLVLYWDGESSKGKVSTGMYIVYLEYRYHNSITKAKKTTVLAR